MLKVVLIVKSQQLNDRQFAQQLVNLPLKILAKVTPGAAAAAAIAKHQPDLILTSTEVAELMNSAVERIIKPARQSVMSSTHHGIQLVPVQDILYFQAEHKYVTVFYKDGELLIDDSLSDLEQEFPDQFVRIHRKFLVANRCIASVVKDDAGKHIVVLRDSALTLPISRRQLPLVRKKLLSKLQ